MNDLVLTNMPVLSKWASVGSVALGPQGEARNFAPVEKTPGTTRVVDLDTKPVTSLNVIGVPQKSYESPMTRSAYASDVNANSVPMQIWEGTVVEVDRESDTMQVLLDAKMGQSPQHTAEIELRWVDDQDQELVRPGAVFYLTLFMRTKPSVENAQELRFRRRPTWTSSQIEQIERDAAELQLKIQTAPLAQ